MENTSPVIAKREERKRLIQKSFEGNESVIPDNAQEQQAFQKAVAGNIASSVTLEKGLQKPKKEPDHGIIGHTRSGKPIYDQYDNPGHAKFDSWDHEEAARLHAQLSETTDGKKHIKEGNKHYEKSLKMRSSIGQTESGKSVYSDYEHPDHKSFTKKDHNDAAKLHLGEMQRASYAGNNDRVKHHNEQHDKHMCACTGEAWGGMGGDSADKNDKENLMKAMSECTTTTQVMEMMEKGGLEIFGQRQIETYTADLRKSFDADEINHEDFANSIGEVHALPSVLVKSLDGTEDIKVFYRLKKEKK